ncbi:ATP synthase F1 subunit epsilon [Elusimicrobiota bacterium]
MNKSLSVELVTPEKVAVKDLKAERVVLPALEGEMGVLPGHEPFMVQLVSGVIRVTESGEVSHFAISGGFAQVLDDRVSVFAETAEASTEIDVERAKQALERARAERGRRRGEVMTLAQADAAIARAHARLKVAEKFRPKRKVPKAPKFG